MGNNTAKLMPVKTTPDRPKAGTEPSASAADIVSQLRRGILQGDYAFNERLPPERQLAAEFGAARGTVRAALRQLEAMELVSRRVGSGTFIKYREQLDQEAIATLTSPLELIDVRFGIEPQMVRLAVGNASARDLDQLAQALARVEAVGADSEAFTAADEAYHLALAECSQNPLMVSLYRQINDVRGHAQWSGMKDKVLSAQRMVEYNQQHRALFEAIVARDVATADKLIRLHLHKARDELLGVERL